jgi:hypothetical protein
MVFVSVSVGVCVIVLCVSEVIQVVVDRYMIDIYIYAQVDRKIHLQRYRCHSIKRGKIKRWLMNYRIKKLDK